MRRTTRFTAAVALVGVLTGLLPIISAAPAMAARQKTIKIADASLVEGDSGSKSLSFRVTWNGSKGGGAPSVSYATADVTASEGSDYTATSGTVSLKAGGCRCGTITVPVLGDNVTEGTETLAVNLSAPVGATFGDALAIGTIYDNEGPPSLIVLDAADDEAAGPLSFTVLMTSGTPGTETVDFTTSDGTALAGSDYTKTAGTLSFTGQTAKTISVPVTNETVNEADETFTLTLSNATVAITDATATGTIYNDDTEPTVSIADASANEAAGTVSLTVSLSTASGQEVDVDYATTDVTAVAGEDYTTASGTAVIAAGATTTTIDVPVSDDSVYEGGDQFAVDLSAPFNATPLDDHGIGTITNDDQLPAASIGNVTVTEGAAGTTSAAFAIELSNPSAFDTTVHWATADGSASVGADYTAASGTMTFPAGTTEQQVQVDVLGDTTAELDETFAVSLTTPVGMTIATATGTGTITDDDRTPTALTQRVGKTRTKLVAKGVLEPATSGAQVTVGLYRKKGKKWIKLSARTVAVTKLADRDGDSKPDAAYKVAYKRPAKRGAYRLRATFVGNLTLLPSARTTSFKL